jgi:hypothetical protein
MISETITDMHTVYQLLCTMALNGGHLRATVNDLYSHLPPTEREQHINTIVTNVYSLLPPHQAQTAIKNQEILDRWALLPQDRPLPSSTAPHRGAFHGLKVGLVLGILSWALLIAGFFMLPRFLHHVASSGQGLHLGKYSGS